MLAQLMYQIVYYRYFHPLSKFPGPFWGSVTRIWLALQFYWGIEVETEMKLHAKYGPVVRVTPTMLLVQDSMKLPEMYNRQADKSDYYITPSFGPVENILVARDHKKHTQLRKIMAGPYNYTNIKKMEPLVDARVRRWLDRLKAEFVDHAKPVDFTPWTV
ncbi:hypothetical protein SEUCBS139899_009819 [Sporothrix eucalyptigena]